ncbi:hypothetical protein FACS189468_8150 [Spirochaetia bacterium]|nr:hypothetical protein FACS189468_8150 [Spirochaetia bacterium]
MYERHYEVLIRENAEIVRDEYIKDRVQNNICLFTEKLHRTAAKPCI